MAQENTDSDRLRREQIALAAYYRAQQRGFEPSRELDDWLEAEKQIDGLSSVNGSVNGSAAQGVENEASQRSEALSDAKNEAAGIAPAQLQKAGRPRRK